MGLASSARWAAVSQAARVISQLASITVLARLLPPESYGLMAMAMTVTNLAFLFKDLGTSAAIVQRKELTEDLKCTVYWLNFGFGLLIGLLLVAAAYPIAAGFKQERLSGMLIALALVFPISSLGSVPQALMERESRFRVIARIEAVSSLGGLALAIAIALAGGEIWSLVLQMLFSTTLATVQSFLAAGWRPKMRFVPRELHSIFSFGANLSLFRLVIYLEQNADSIIIGKLLGSAALGIYSMAYKVMLFPVQNLTAVASRVLFPALSRHQGSIDMMAGIYLRSVGTICIMTAPMMAGLYFLREPFVAIVFGPKWAAAAEILKWLAPVGFIQSITAGTGVVFMSLGRSRLMLFLGVLGAALQVGAFVIGVRWGIEGVAASYFVANLLNLLPCFVCSLVLLRVAARDALLEVGKPILASCFMLVILQQLHGVAGFASLSLPAAFALSVAAGAAAYAFALLVLLRHDVSDIRALLRFG